MQDFSTLWLTGQICDDWGTVRHVFARAGICVVVRIGAFEALRVLPPAPFAAWVELFCTCAVWQPGSTVSQMARAVAVGAADALAVGNKG